MLEGKLQDLAARCCLDILVPEGFVVMTSGPCGAVDHEDGQPGHKTLVAPFGCQISNVTRSDDNFGRETVFQGATRR